MTDSNFAYIGQVNDPIPELRKTRETRNLNEAEYREMEDDYNFKRDEDYKRQEDEELDRLKNDSKRLDWVLNGNGTMIIEVESGIDCRPSRESIDRAMWEDRQEVVEAGAIVTDYDRRKCDSNRLDYILSGNGQFTITLRKRDRFFGGRRAAIDIAMRQFYEEQDRRKSEGNTYFNPCGMMCNADGTRSIFDDVDQ